MKPTAAIVGMTALASLAFILVSFGHNQDPVEQPLPYSQVPKENQKPAYRLIPHPLYNPQKLVEEFQPLVDYLNRALPETPIRIEASRDYQAFEKKIRAREADILMPNPWQAIEAMKVGYHVVAMWGDADDFRGIFILRKDSRVKNPSDLKGKAISYPSPTALAAAIMPQYFLFTHGIDIKKDIQNVYVGSQESSIMNVFLGATAAGATWPPPWRQFQKDHPAQAEQLTVAWETPSLINNAVMVRDNLPPDFGQRLQQALLDLPKTAEGQKILKDIETARFHAANDKSYAIVREYVERFEKEVRKVEIP